MNNKIWYLISENCKSDDPIAQIIGVICGLMMISAVIFAYGRMAYRDIKDYIAKKKVK